MVRRGFIASVRYLNGLTLYFKDKQSVHVWDERGSYIIVRRMDRPKRGYYKLFWKPFIENLCRNNSFSSTIQVANLAVSYDLTVISPSSQLPPKIPDNILIRPSKFKGGNVMGIFKPTDTSEANVVVYSKWCIECEEPGDMVTLNQWALHNELELQVVRTAYRPADHKRATEIFGSEDYPAFVVYNDVFLLKEFVKMIRDGKNKLIKPGRDKETDSDVQRLSTAERLAGKDSMDVPANKSKKEYKGRNKK